MLILNNLVFLSLVPHVPIFFLYFFPFFLISFCRILTFFNLLIIDVEGYCCT